MAFHEAQGTAKNSIAAIARLFLSACALGKVKLIDTSPVGVHDVETMSNAGAGPRQSFHRLHRPQGLSKHILSL